MAKPRRGLKGAAPHRLPSPADTFDARVRRLGALLGDATTELELLPSGAPATWRATMQARLQRGREVWGAWRAVARHQDARRAQGGAGIEELAADVRQAEAIRAEVRAAVHSAGWDRPAGRNPGEGAPISDRDERWTQ